MSDFMLHLKRHLTENVAIACPFNKCNKIFTVKSSFTSHISRIHHEPSASDLCDKMTKTVEIPLEDMSIVSTVNVNMMNDDTDMELWHSADASVKSTYRNTYFTERDDSIMRDVTDDRAFKGNALFAHSLGAFRIILYQDSFEVANPLGSGKKKHKILAVYFSLANFPPHMQSSVDQIQLVLLCRESDFKCFGQEIVFF